MKIKTLSVPALVLFLILITALTAFPFLVSSYMLQVAVYCGIFIMLAVSLDLLVGYTGIFSMGHVGFYCAGAYTSALLATKLGLPFTVCFLASGLVAALIGAMVGFVALRLSDVFLAFATMGLGEVIRIVIQNASFTNGALGVTGIPMPQVLGRPMTRVEFYYLVLIIVVALVVLTNQLVHSNTGRTWRAIRDDTNAAASLGINVFRYKMTAMVLSCFVAGLAGSLYAAFVQYINSASFTISVSINILAMVTIGGMGTVIGPIIGAILLQVLPESSRFLADYRQLMFGAALVISIMFAPRGLVGLPWRKLRVIDRLCSLFDPCDEKKEAE